MAATLPINWTSQQFSTSNTREISVFLNFGIMPKSSLLPHKWDFVSNQNPWRFWSTMCNISKKMVCQGEVEKNPECLRHSWTVKVCINWSSIFVHQMLHSSFAASCSSETALDFSASQEAVWPSGCWLNKLRHWLHWKSWIHVRRETVQKKTFHCELFEERSIAAYSTDLRDWGLHLSRRFKALKVWFIMRLCGVEGLRRHVNKVLMPFGLWCFWSTDSHLRCTAHIFIRIRSDMRHGELLRVADWSASEHADFHLSKFRTVHLSIQRRRF